MSLSGFPKLLGEETVLAPLHILGSFAVNWLTTYDPIMFRREYFLLHRTGTPHPPVWKRSGRHNQPSKPRTRSPLPVVVRPLSLTITFHLFPKGRPLPNRPNLVVQMTTVWGRQGKQKSHLQPVTQWTGSAFRKGSHHTQNFSVL